MRFRVSVSLDVEGDVTDLRERALELLAGGEITSTDGIEPPFGIEVNAVAQPEHAMLMVWHGPSLEASAALEQALPDSFRVGRWNPSIEIDPPNFTP